MISLDDTGARAAWVVWDDATPPHTAVLLAERQSDGSFETVWEWEPPPDPRCPDGYVGVHAPTLSPDGTRMVVTLATICDVSPEIPIEMYVERYVFD